MAVSTTYAHLWSSAHLKMVTMDKIPKTIASLNSYRNIVQYIDECGDTMSTSMDAQYIRGYHEYIRGYHEYIIGI